MQNPNRSVGADLLNQQSKEQAAAIQKQKFIRLEDILTNEMNNYEINEEEVESLVESIRNVGLQQNLVVIPVANGKYKLTTGHKRFTALQRLYKENNDKWEFVNCTITNIKDVNLPVSDELKELYLITTTNAEGRNKASDLYTSYRNLQQIYTEAKKNGYKMPGRIRELLSNQLQVSTGQISKLEAIQKQGIKEVIEAIQNEQFANISVAYEVAQQPKEVQEKILESAKESQAPITSKDVKEITDKEKEEDNNTKVNVNVDALLKEILNDNFIFTDNNYQISSKEYNTILQSINRIGKELSKISKIIK